MKLQLKSIKCLGLKNKVKEFKIKQLNIFENEKHKIRKNNRIYDFIYPATYKPHKNHENLLKALIILTFIFTM